MSEKLIIQNFGPITNVDLDLRKVNVLIGDQGTGKSTVAKVLIAIVNSTYLDLLDIAKDDLLSRETQLFLEHLKIVEVYSCLNESTEIKYTCETFSFEFLNGVVNFLKKPSNYQANSLYNFDYIPAERIMISTLANSLYSLMLNDVALPKLILRFGDKFQKGRIRKDIFDYTKILGIKYMYKNDRDIIILPSGKEIFMQDASSGIQASITLLVVFDYVSEISKQNNLLVVEEPEINCFPNTQNELLQYFIRKNSFGEGNSNFSNQILITTHSPYILTSLNNLMYAHGVGKEHFEETDKIIPSKNWLNPNDVSVYKLVGGESVSIIDDELKQIKVEEIDEISEGLSTQWHEMAELNLVKH